MPLVRRLADAVELLEGGDFLVQRKRRRRVGKRFRAFNLEPLDLLSHESEALELACDLSLEILSKGASVASARCLKLVMPGAAEQAFDLSNSVKRADPIDMARPLADKLCPLTADALGILCLRRRNGHGAEDAFIAVEIGAELECHGFGVDTIRLCPAAPA